MDMAEPQGTGATVEQLLRMLLEDRQRREQELREERERRETELREERERREREITEEHRRHEDEMKLLRDLVESGRKEERRTTGKQGLDGIKLTKLTDGDDIESFLTVFERIMVAQEIPEER